MKKLIFSILYSAFFFNASAQQQLPKVEHLKITGDKMIFDKVYYVESQAHPFIKAQAGQSFSEGYIEVYAECPSGLLTPDDFLFKISTIGLLLTYKNCQDYFTDFSNKMIGSFNKWEIDEAGLTFMTPKFFHSKLIINLNNIVTIQMLRPNNKMTNFIVISETNMSLINFTNKFSTYNSFKAVFGL